MAAIGAGAVAATGVGTASSAGAATTAAAAGTSTAAAGGGIGFGLAAKVIAVVAIAGAVGGTTVAVVQPWEAEERSEGAEATTSPSTTTDTDTATDTATATDTVMRPRVRRDTPAIVAPPVEVTGPSQLQEETRLLREARAAKLRGDLAAATRALDEHHQRFPAGMLAQERDRIRSSLTAPAPSPAPPEAQP
jgi:hypothetical protein